MGQTITQKILQRASEEGNARVDNVVIARASAVMISEALGPKFFSDRFAALGKPVFDPDRVVCVIDHYSPSATIWQADLNRFTIDENERELSLHEYNENVVKEQIESLNETRRTRDNGKVEKHLENLRAVANRDENLMPHLIDAFRDYVSLGEVCRILKEEFGIFEQPTVI